MEGQQKINSGLNFLSVVWFKVLPPKYGGQKGIAHFNKHLATVSSLVCLCSENNFGEAVPYKVENTLPTNKLQFINPYCWYKILKSARDHNVTHIIFEFPYYGFAAFFCKMLLGIKVINRGHNIEYQRFRQQKKWYWRLLYYFEGWTYRQSHLNVFVSETDQDKAVKEFGLSPGKCLVVPYCIERPIVKNKDAVKQDLKRKYNLTDEEKIILFAGTLDYPPNASAVEYIYETILPLTFPEFTIPF